MGFGKSASHRQRIGSGQFLVKRKKALSFYWLTPPMKAKTKTGKSEATGGNGKPNRE
jgi:hypothetical protein